MEPLTMAERFAFKIAGAVLAAILGETNTIYCLDRKAVRKVRAAIAEMQMPAKLRRLIKVKVLPPAGLGAPDGGFIIDDPIGAKHGKE